MEEAFDPFGSEEVTSSTAALGSPAQLAATEPFRKPPDSSSFDPFQILDDDPFAIAVNLTAQTTDDKKQQRNEDAFLDDNNNAELHTFTSVVRTTSNSAARTAALALPPKLNVKLFIHEEVSSTAMDCDGASKVYIEGEVKAQVRCSDALKNAPFVLSGGPPPPSSSQQNWKITPIADVAKLLPQTTTTADDEKKKNLLDQFLVHIPKHEIGLVPTAFFSLTGTVDHMPILLERKVMISGTSCRVAVQVRSKLSNAGNLHDFAIAMVVPEAVNGESIHIVRGDGYYDELKRTIHWKLPELRRGSSFMVSAQLSLWEEGNELSFPVMMRCTSLSDQIGEYQALNVHSSETHPSSVTCTTQRSFRLLHRLT